jgi:hypothetical protein
MLVLALIVQRPNSDSTESLDTQSFQVFGWHCVREDCNATRSGPLPMPVHFAEQASKRVIARAERLRADWAVDLECGVSRGRLQDCKVDRRYSQSAGREIALKLAAALKLTTDEPKSGRVIISVTYATSGCPNWLCVHEGPVPPLATNER